MSLSVHHLNCCTMTPIGGRFVSGERGVKARLVCHCLLIETDDGLVLVDTGLGRADVEHPVERLGRPWIAMTRPKLDLEETAYRQLERLGFATDDVRHIVVTHLDVDHAGGLGDFPRATVHVSAPEHQAAMSRGTRLERFRYVAAQWAHQPEFATYEPSGEAWFDLDRVRQLESLPPEILLVPLDGHSRGHCGVAIETSDGWLLHCGDAYLYRDMLAAEPRCPLGLRLFAASANLNGKQSRDTVDRLRRLKQDHGDEIQIICAHDPIELEALRG